MPDADRPSPAGPFLVLAVPALFLACWTYWATGGTGIMPARAVMPVLAGAALALLVATARDVRLPRWSWTSPLPWLAAALLWQAAGLLRSPLPVVGGALVAERVLALAAALALVAFRAPWWTAGLWALAILGGDVVAMHVPGFAGFCGPAAPFGNQNFNAAAVPLAVLAAGLAWRSEGPGLKAAGAMGLAGLVLALVMGSPEPLGHGTRAIWLVLAVGIGTWLALGLHRVVGPLLIAAGALAMVAVQQLCIIGRIPVDWAGASWEQRIWFWRASLRAIGESPWIGLGPGSALDALQRQPETCGHWLAVPSFAEHTHCEPLQALLDGGVAGLLLVAAGLVATLIPVWRRRDEPIARALLAAWAAFLAHALVESHLSQPGPLWCLALLAGLTWAWSAALEPVDRPLRRLPALTLGGAGLVLAGALIVDDFTGGGSPPMRWRRAYAEADLAEALGDHRGAAEALARLRRVLGPLDDLPMREALHRIRAGELDEAERLLAFQLRHLPVVGDAIGMGRWLVKARRQRGQEPTPELVEALAEAERIGREWAQATRETPKNAAHLGVLKRMVGVDQPPAGR